MRIVWYCPECDEEEEYDEPGECPVCSCELEKWEEEIEWDLFCTPWYCDDFWD